MLETQNFLQRSTKLQKVQAPTQLQNNHVAENAMDFRMHVDHDIKVINRIIQDSLSTLLWLM